MTPCFQSNQRAAGRIVAGTAAQRTRGVRYGGTSAGHRAEEAAPGLLEAQALAVHSQLDLRPKISTPSPSHLLTRTSACRSTKDIIQQPIGPIGLFRFAFANCLVLNRVFLLYFISLEVLHQSWTRTHAILFLSR